MMKRISLMVILAIDHDDCDSCELNGNMSKTPFQDEVEVGSGDGRFETETRLYTIHIMLPGGCPRNGQGSYGTVLLHVPSC